jgi:hypothetical protein
MNKTLGQGLLKPMLRRTSYGCLLLLTNPRKTRSSQSLSLRGHHPPRLLPTYSDKLTSALQRPKRLRNSVLRNGIYRKIIVKHMNRNSIIKSKKRKHRKEKYKTKRNPGIYGDQREKEPKRKHRIMHRDMRQRHRQRDVFLFSLTVYSYIHIYIVWERG